MVLALVPDFVTFVSRCFHSVRTCSPSHLLGSPLPRGLHAMRRPWTRFLLVFWRSRVHSETGESIARPMRAGFGSSIRPNCRRFAASGSTMPRTVVSNALCFRARFCILLGSPQTSGSPISISRPRHPSPAQMSGNRGWSWDRGFSKFSDLPKRGFFCDRLHSECPCFKDTPSART